MGVVTFSNNLPGSCYKVVICDGIVTSVCDEFGYLWGSAGKARVPALLVKALITVMSKIDDFPIQEIVDSAYGESLPSVSEIKMTIKNDEIKLLAQLKHQVCEVNKAVDKVMLTLNSMVGTPILGSEVSDPRWEEVKKLRLENKQLEANSLVEVIRHDMREKFCRSSLKNK